MYNQRKRHTDIYEEIVKIVQENIKTIIEINKINNKTLGETIGVHPNTVGKWILGIQLPQVDALRKISDQYKVSMDWLTRNDRGHYRGNIEAERTYAEIIIKLAELNAAGVLKDDLQLDDPFLKFLYKEISRINSLPKSKAAERDNYLFRITSDFKQPLMPSEQTGRFGVFRRKYASIDEYSTYHNCFMAMEEEWEKYNNYVGNAVKEGTILSFKEWIKKGELTENSPVIDVKSEP